VSCSPVSALDHNLMAEGVAAGSAQATHHQINKMHCHPVLQFSVPAADVAKEYAYELDYIPVQACKTQAANPACE